ncbi:hypothetical protein VNO77_01487 [Canavalia gladiata]|uniref:Uncharacterized protein n=1 Tax=Canavalia gladiata TaxID=3824 RepID=A0AAN9R5A4_CANGL
MAFEKEISNRFCACCQVTLHCKEKNQRLMEKEKARAESKNIASLPMTLVFTLFNFVHEAQKATQKEPWGNRSPTVIYEQTKLAAKIVGCYCRRRDQLLPKGVNQEMKWLLWEFGASGVALGPHYPSHDS